MNLTDLYLLFGLTIPVPDLLPDFQAYETSITVNYNRHDDARPGPDDSDDSDNTMVNFFKYGE